ncbi:MAG: hypothetical protein ABI760_18635 [Ferruginibacter sp.]
MFLITSAAYITSGLATEYGRIPPSFLPLQNKRLYEHQLALLKPDEAIVLSLPAGFVISEKDNEILELHKVIIVYVPEGFSLGQSIVYVLNVTARYNEPLNILHGDTLFESIPWKPDAYLIGKASDNYPWASSEDIKNDEFVYAGYFSFSNQSLLIKSITESNYDFVNGILLYKHRKEVKEEMSDTWLDFGHANTYYRSRTHLTTQRFFNDLKIDGFSVIKYSNDNNKIQAEANWFSNMPVALKRYIPALWNSGTDLNKSFYQIEYFYLSSLAELYVYGKNEFFIWQNILSACNEFLMDCMKFTAPVQLNIAEKANRLYSEKTLLRLQTYAKETGIDLDRGWIYNGIHIPSLNTMVEELNSFISVPSIDQQSIIHGDFGFSNILYDFRTKSIKVIDPRGIDVEGNQTIYGDIRYDIAKLAHSVMGMYDFIIAGYFSYVEEGEYNIKFSVFSNPTIEKIQDFFKTNSFAGMNIREACTFPILVHLFLSMLPLHKDNLLRQKAMLANAFRLYLEFREFKEK